MQMAKKIKTKGIKWSIKDLQKAPPNVHSESC